MRKWVLIISSLFWFWGAQTGCDQLKEKSTSDSENIDSSQQKKETAKPKKEKKQVDLSEPVAAFSDNLEDEVTNNDFFVQVYPTENPNIFKVNIQFGGNKARDNVEFPPAKYFDKVALRKGEKPNTCIIGFVGKDGDFNEMKEIVCTTTSIKINTLKAYYFKTK